MSSPANSLNSPITQYNTLVGDSGNKIANVSPGSAGQALVSNGASSNPSYQTITPSIIPPNIAGTTIGTATWQTTAMQTGSLSPSNGSTTIATADRIYLFQVYLPYTASYTKIAAILTSGNSANNIRLGLYNIANGLPSTVLVDSGNISIAATGVKQATGLSFSITSGWYYFGITIDGGTPVFRKFPSTLLNFAALPIDTADTAAPANYLYYDNTFGALPTITQSSLVINGHNILPVFFIS